MKERLRYGFTTGTCAQAAAKAAAFMLFLQSVCAEVEVETPLGKKVCLPVEDAHIQMSEASCAVIKDAGDDPDATDGIWIYANVRFGEDKRNSSDQSEIRINGGEGIGRVTKPGLDRPVGDAAINTVPRSMIKEAVADVCALFDYRGVVEVTISAPVGKEIAKKTMNERLGICGGISILGTTGIVTPMSSDALLASIRLEIHQKKLCGANLLPIALGNYGRQFLADRYGFEIDDFVKCSNYIGNAIEMGCREGFDKLLLVGHVGKLAKVAGGVLNTHSRYGDCRMNQLAAAFLDCGGDAGTTSGIRQCVSADEAIRLIAKKGKEEQVMKRLLAKVLRVCRRKATLGAEIEVLMFSNVHGILAASEKAHCFLNIMQGIG